jgi:hypothetical protein
MATTITDLTNHLEIAFSPTHKVTVPKAGLRVATKNNFVYLIPKGLERENWGHANVIRILYTDAVPLLGSAELLMDVIIGYLDSFYSSTGGGGGAAGGGSNTYSTEQGDFTATPTDDSNLIVLSVDSIGGVAIAENHFANAILKVHNDDTDEMITFALNDFTWTPGTKTLDTTNDTNAFTFANSGGDVDGGYTFDASEQTVTITGIRTLLLEEFISIVNVTDNIVIYNANDSSRGGSISSNVVTLDFDTTAMSDTDDLAIKIHYNNSEDFELNGIRAYIQNTIPPNYDSISGDLLSGTPFELGSSFADLASEIPMSGKNRLRVWITLDIGTSTTVQIRRLDKHTSGGAEEYREIYLGSPAANKSTINLHDYEVGSNADQLFSFILETDGTVPFIQLQAKDSANGDGQIDALYVSKAWV